MTETAISRVSTAHVLAAVAAAFVPMAIFASKSLAPLFAVGAVAVAALELARHRRLPLILGPVSAFLAAFGSWSLVTWFWSIAPNDTVKTGLSLAASLLGAAILIGGAARLDARGRQIFDRGLVVGGAIGFALVAFEFATDAWLSRTLYGLVGKQLFLVGGRYTAAMNPGLAASALFVWPWALAVKTWFPRRAAAIAVGATLALFALAKSDAVFAGIVAGAVVFAAALAWSRVMPWVLAAVIAIGVGTAPLVPAQLPNPLDPDAKTSWMTLSLAHRILIWKTTAQHIRNKPVLGGGFDTARALYSVRDRAAIHYPKSIIGLPVTTEFEPIPLHPHNGILQVWLETGMVGAVILIGLLLSVVRAVAIGGATAGARAAALAQLTTTLTIGAVSFGAWQSWWLAAIVLAGVLMVARLGAPVAATPAPTPIRTPPPTGEIGGPKGPEPTRYGDWERKGRAIDF